MAEFQDFEISGEDAEVLFIALAVVEYDDNRPIGEPVDYAMVGMLASKELGRETYRDPNVVKRVFRFYQQTFNVTTYAEFQDLISKQLDRTYQEQSEREGEMNLMQLAMNRKAGRNLQRRQLNKVAQLLLIQQVVYDIMEHVSPATLNSQELLAEINGIRFDTTMREYRKILSAVITHSDRMVGAHCPNFRGNASTIRDMEILHCYKCLQFIGYGPRHCWDKQRALYAQDMSRLAKFASFQTLASFECYHWLGERFHYNVNHSHRQEEERVKDLLERFQHVKVIGDIMEKMDPIDMARMKKKCTDDYLNAAVRKKEMFELDHRFTNIDLPLREHGVSHFSRYSDESQIREPNVFDLKKHCATIFYEILKEAKTCPQTPPNTLQVIQRLFDDGTFTERAYSPAFLKLKVEHGHGVDANQHDLKIFDTYVKNSMKLEEQSIRTNLN